MTMAHVFGKDRNSPESQQCDSHQVKRLDSGPSTAMVAGQPVPNRRPGLALLCFGFTRDRAEQSMMQAFSSEGTSAQRS